MRPIKPLTTIVSATPFGVITGAYQVYPIEINAPIALPAKVDLVAVIDRSGSMWNEIESVKSGLSKLLGVHEVLGGKVDMSLSLISYSSDGDCMSHFSHINMEKATSDKHVASQI